MNFQITLGQLFFLFSKQFSQASPQAINYKAQ
jgi:hypothetical protein